MAKLCPQERRKRLRRWRDNQLRTMKSQARRRAALATEVATEITTSPPKTSRAPQRPRVLRLVFGALSLAFLITIAVTY